MMYAFLIYLIGDSILNSVESRICRVFSQCDCGFRDLREFSRMECYIQYSRGARPAVITNGSVYIRDSITVCLRREIVRFSDDNEVNEVRYFINYEDIISVIWKD